MIVAHFKNVYKHKSAKFIKQLSHISLLGGVFKSVIDNLSDVKTKKNSNTGVWGEKKHLKIVPFDT